MLSQRPGPTARPHYARLDGLRGIAAGTVLFGHATAWMYGRTFVPRKALAVQFFFMLSGFVLSYAYGGAIRDGMRFRDFFVRRVIRLYPLIATGALLGAAWLACTEPAFWRSARPLGATVLAILALPSFDPGFGFSPFPINPPEWSLFFEMVAYTLFALVLARLGVRALAFFVAVALVCFAVNDVQFFGRPIPLWMGIFGCLSSFGTGMLLWELRARDRLPTVPMPFALLAVATAILCAVPHRFGAGVDLLAVAVVFPAVIASGAANGRAPPGSVVRALGDLSFPVYILHWPFLLFAHRVIEPHFGPAAAAAAGMGAAIGAALIAFRFFDQPIRRRLTRRFAAARSTEGRSAVVLALPGR